MKNVYFEGIPVATKQISFSQKHYVEWQIGYDAVIGDNKKTTLIDKTFVGANGKNKALYELSEYIYYFYKWNVITKLELLEIKEFIENADDKSLIDVNNNYNILRSGRARSMCTYFPVQYEESPTDLQAL